MKKLVFLLMVSAAALGCKKQKQPAPVAIPCVACYIEGIIINAESGRPQVNKPVALLLHAQNLWVDDDYSENDPFVLTDDNGYFKIGYNTSTAGNKICLYPRLGESYSYGSVRIMGALETGKHYNLGKIYTNVYFP